MPNIYRLLGWRCGHSAFVFKEKPCIDGNLAHVRRPYHCQSPFDDGIRGHGSQLWNLCRNSIQPFCSQMPSSSVIFLSGLNIQNRSVCNWFCTPFKMMDGRLYPAASDVEKCCWCFFFGFHETWICWCFNKRPILSETAWEYGNTAKPFNVGLVDLVVNSFSHLLIKEDVWSFPQSTAFT